MAKDQIEIILALEERRAKALIERDVAALQDILRDDLVYTHSNARIETKKELIEAIERGDAVYKTLDLSDPQVKIYDSAAVLSGVVYVKGESRSRLVDLRVRITNVYVKGPRGWALSASQSTAIPA